jgi:quercetin dioxygenase-like cupin family protein
MTARRRPLAADPSITTHETESTQGSHTKEGLVDYTFLANLQQEFALPEKGILSRVLHKDSHVNVTLFGFSAGQELSAHSAPTPAILYFLEGEAEVQLGEEKVKAQPGSFVYMPPMLPHGIAATTALRMLLVQIAAPAAAPRDSQ